MIISALVAVAAMSTAPTMTANTLDGTRAGEIAARFGASMAPRAEAVTGWQAGRCYTVANPNQPLANLFVYESRTPPPGNEGPIFDRPVTKMLVVQHTDGAARPDLFDNMTPEMQAQVSAYLDQAFASSEFSEVFSGDNAMSAYYNQTRYDSRDDGQYVYVRVSNRANNADFAYCYFFKKVR